LLLVSWSGSIARGQTPVGAEFQVNTVAAGDQEQAAVAADDDGDFVVVWSSSGEDGSSSGVFARRFDAAGVAQGGAFQVNVHVTLAQYRPSVAMDDDGDFVVVWASDGQDGSSHGIFARRFDSSGVAQGLETQVNTVTAFSQNFPAVAMDADGDFVVAWQSYHDGSGVGIFAQRFDAAGVAQDGEFQVNTFTAGYQAYPTVAMDDAGAFVVAWDSDDQDGDDDGIFAQRYDASGAPVGGELQVNTTTDSDQTTPSAAMDGDGDFVVAWKSLGQDGAGNGIFAQRFDSMGAPQGDEIQVNSRTDSDQIQPQAAIDDEGNFVVVWNSFLQDGAVGGIFGQLFDSSGAARGAEFPVNTTTFLDQAFPSAAMDADGDFVVAWESSFQDGDQGGIFAQRFSPDLLTIVVSLDLHPGVFPNRINVGSNGSVTVAILTTSVSDGDPVDFDAFEVDPSTVGFGPLRAPAQGQPHAKDVDRDGDLDMTLRFHLQATGIPCGAAMATLGGETFEGQPFVGTDSVLTLGCR
jgi:hypothetical protein